MGGFWHGVAIFLGLTNAGGRAYSFWSGVGSDLGELTILGAVVAGYRRVNCHAHRCWRLGRHPVGGTPYVTCRKHHPQIDGRVTAEHIARAHDRAQRAEPVSTTPSA